MTEPAPELLVVLGPAGSPDPVDPSVPPDPSASVLDALAGIAPVASVMRPRLALLAAPAALLGEIAAVPGVVGVFATAPPPALLETLDDRERLFVDGWVTRLGPPPCRPGDGLPWDSPPRLPPDPPPGP